MLRSFISILIALKGPQELVPFRAEPSFVTVPLRLVPATQGYSADLQPSYITATYYHILREVAANELQWLLWELCGF